MVASGRIGLLRPLRLPSSENSVPKGERPPARQRGRAAALLILALALCLGGSLPGGTAHADVLVSNIGQTANDSRVLGIYRELAQGFTTGSNANGYTLTTIEIKFANSNPRAAPTVTLRAGFPRGDIIATLTGPANVGGGDGIATFNLPTNITVLPGTAYYVRMEGGVNDTSVALTSGNEEDSGGATGWSIEDDGRSRTGAAVGAGGILEVFINRTPSALIRVNGTANANTGPMASASTVTMDEDTVRSFRAADFNFTGAGMDDTLSGVRILTLPAIGALTLDGVNVTPYQLVGSDDIDANKLVYAPVAEQNGDDYAGFLFKVSDGTRESGLYYRMTVDVTAVNDAPTGKPGVIRHVDSLEEAASAPKAGNRLTIDTEDIADPDGLPTRTLRGPTQTGVINIFVPLPRELIHTTRWLRVDGNTESNIVGAVEKEYTLTKDDVGKNIRVKVTYTDDEGFVESLTSNLFPSRGTVRGNIAPTTADTTVTARENSAYAFRASDFDFSDADRFDSLKGVRIERRPAVGTFQLDGTNVTELQKVTRAELDARSLVFTPAGVGDGYTSFAFTVSDGVDRSASHTMTIDVRAAAGAPGASDGEVETDEDTGYIFEADDFNFSGVSETDTLSKVRIVTLPKGGSLQFRGTDATANQEVRKVDLDIERLVYTPAANANGDDYDSFNFKVNNGTNESASDYRMTIDVTAVNDAATGKPGIEGTTRVGQVLTASPVGIVDIDGVTRAADGDAGYAYTYQWIRVDGGTESDISGAMSRTYTLASDDSGKTVKVRVGFKDDADSAEAVTSDASAAVRAADATSAAPTSADKTVTTGEDTAYMFAPGDFPFTDSDTGDAFTSVRIVGLPSAGSLTLSGTNVAANSTVAKADLEGGKLAFTPAPNANGAGYASFTFKVSDGVAESAAPYTMTVDVTAVNDVPSGLPAVTGRVARVGRDVTADVSSIADIDGLTRAANGDAGYAFAYQWIRVTVFTETAITGATSGTYELSTADENKKVKVRVSFQDDAGNAASLTSAAYPRYSLVHCRNCFNALPTSADATVTMPEDSSYRFGANSFPFRDRSPSDALAGVKIVTPPSAGSLQLGGVDVAADTVVPREDLDAGRFVFTPVPDRNGSGYASFTFKVQDSRDDSTSSYTMTIDVTAVNDAATGKPAITGTARIGRTLAATTAAIADVDGLTKAEAGDTGHAFAYQWVRVDGANDTEISGATLPGYTLVAADVGKTVKVKVSFTDDAGGAESVTSDATGTVEAADAANAAPTAADKTVTAEEDAAYTFGAGDFGFTDPDTADVLAGVKIVTPPSAGTLAVNGTAVTADQAVSRAALDAGRLAFTPAANANGGGYASFTFTVSDGAAESAAANTITVDVTAVNDTATGRPTITGAADVGRTLMAVTTGIADVDGLTKAAAGEAGHAFAYQWVRVDGGAESDISGARSSTYTLADEDEDKTIKVTVSFTDDADNAESLTSDATGTVRVRVAPTAADKTVTIAEDTAHVFAVDDFGFSDANPDDALVSVRIVTLPSAGTLAADGTAVTADQTVSKADLDAGKLVYTPAADANGTGYASFTFTVSDGRAESATANTITIDVTPVNESATGKPAIMGTALVGMRLAASTAGIEDEEGLTKARAGDQGHAFTYQWLRVDGATATEISQATAFSYRLVSADAGNMMKVKVSFADDAGNAESVTSDASETVGTRAFAAPARSDVLVSNIGRSNDSSTGFRSWDHAQGFRTGDNPGGYALNSIEVEFLRTSSNPVAATLHKGNPASAPVTALVGGSSGVTGGANTFMAPADTVLDPNSTYYIAMETPLRDSGRTVLPITDSNAEDTTGKSDWAVLDIGHFRSYSTTGGYQEWVQSRQIRVNGAELADATLSGLALSMGSLDPTFEPLTRTYTALVGNAASRITVVPTVNTTGARVEYLDSRDTAVADADAGTGGHQADLSVGENTIKVKVISAQGTATSTYTLVVTRAAADASADATLSALALGFGTLSPAFAAATERYTASVPNSVSRITVTPAANHAEATVKHLDSSDRVAVDADAGRAGHQVNLAVGANTFKVRVTAEDATTKTYTVTVTRAAAGARFSGALVSNLNQGGDSNRPNNLGVAQAFTTGSNSGGYTLGGVAIVSEDPEGHTFSLSVCSVGAEGRPTTTCTLLTAPGSFAAGTLTFTAPSGTTLAADTTYALVARANTPRLGNPPETVIYDSTTSDNEDSGAARSWSISNNTFYTNGVVWLSSRFGHSLRVAILGMSTGGTDATLSDLTLSAGALDPAFDAATESYTASVINTVSRITVTPTASQSGATVSYLDAGNTAIADADGATAGHQVNLSTGANTIKVRVTSQDSANARTYTVTVTRADTASTDATLSGLALSEGTLDPVFASTTGSYTASVLNPVSRITVTPTANHAGATVAYLDSSGTALADADSDTTGHQVDLAVGETAIKVTVTAENGATAMTYTVTVTRISADATLSGLALSEGTLDPPFDSATETYTVPVTASVSQITVTPTPNHSDATLVYRDSSGALLIDADGSTAGQQVDLPVGETAIKVSVTAQDRRTTRTYTVTVTRPGATLSALALSSGLVSPRLNPAFHSAIGSYTASVGNSVSRITVTPRASYAAATVAYLNASDMAIADADASTGGHQVNLAVGANTIKVKVSAEGGTLTKTYTVTLSRAAASTSTTPTGTVATLVSNLGVSSRITSDKSAGGYEGQGFTTGPASGGYALSGADIRYADSEGDSFSMSVCLANASGFPTTTCTALAAPGSFSVGTLGFRAPSGTVLAANTTYLVVLDLGIELVTFPLVYSDDEDPGAAAGWSISDRHISRYVGLAWESDSNNEGEYRIAVKGRVINTDATLSGLGLSVGKLGPAFDSATETYAATVIHSVSRITVMPTLNDSAATVAYLDSSDAAIEDADADASGHQVDLVPGANAIRLRVTAEDGTTAKTYTVTVTRIATASTDATLSALALSAGKLSPAFAPATKAYTASVINFVSRITVAPTANHAGVKAVSFLNSNNMALTDADTTADGHQVDLAVGETAIKVRVTAEDDTTTETYTITVRRAAAGTTGTQTGTTLVSNIGQDDTGSALFAMIGSDSGLFGQQFTTGSNEDGYILMGITINIGSISGSPTPTVSLRKSTTQDSTEVPGAKVLDLSGSITGVGEATFTPSIGTMLDAATRYFVTINLTGGGINLVGTGSGDEDANAADGWAIANHRVYTRDSGSTHSVFTIPLEIAVRGTPLASTVSADASLSDLTLSDGTLDPEFASATEGYTASVIHSVDELTLTPTATEATATVAYLNASNAAIADADGTAEGHQVALTVGENTIKVKVTAGNGTTEKTYTVTVTRGTAAADATLSGLTLSPGTLAPEFASTTEGYTASVANAVSRLTVTPTASQSGATVSYLDGENATLSDADGATAGHQVDLTVGENTIKVGVTATDGTTTKTYTVTVTRASSTDATLSGLTVSAGTLDPEFASATEGYTASVIHSVDELTLTPTATEATATVSYLDGENATLADADGAAEGHQVALTVGSNTIKVKVTAGNGTTEKTYTVTVTRGTAAADATLSGLTLSPGTLAPEFASTTEGYTASVANAVSRLTVTPTASQSEATLSYLDGDNATLSDADGATAGHQVDLTVGENTIKVGVTATDGTTTKTYTVTVTRASSTDATLSGLTVSAGTLDPEFASATEGYTASVIHSVDELTLTPTATEATATVAYLDGENATLADADGEAEGHQVALTVGSNTIKVKVTAGNGTTEKTYTVTVTRGTAAADATLSGLTLSPGTLAPEFASTTEGYTASVANAVSRLTVTPTASQSGATLSYLDGDNATLSDADGATAGHQVDLTVGENTIKVGVTATDGTTTKTYTVTVTRASSTDATLSGLTVSDGTLDPEFASATEGYTASVIHSVDELTLTPTATEATATVAYLNASNAAIADADGTAEGHQVALTVGSNTIKVKVTAGNGTTEKTYTVTVTRGTAAADATLSGLTLSPGTLAPEFASTTEGYTASVANAVSRLTVTPTASQSGATVSYLDGENATLSDADGATAGHQVDLTVGENTIKVGVTATDGTTTKTYTVTVTRASSTDATLSGLTVSAGTLDPEFASATEGYTASVIHSVDELTLTPTATEATATVSYLDGENATLADADGAAEGHQVALTVGSNTIKVKVTAGNGTTEKTYTVTVTRGTAAADATLSGLTLSPGTLAPEFASTTEGYTASVANAVSRLTVTPTASQSEATLSYLDGDNATLSDADGATAGHQVDLTVGENTIKVGVTATDGTTTKTYTVTVTRASSTDATLSGLTVSAGTLDPEFASATEGYTASVIHSVDELTLTPTATEATATVAYLDGENATLADADGEAEGHQVALTVGSNTIKVKVTAGNGTTEKTYTVTVTRGTAAADATLSGLTLSPGTLAPEFASTTEGYTASVANAVSRLTVTPTASQSGATLSYLDGDNATLSDADGATAGHQVDLTVGENTIKVGVTATDGTTTKTYTVTVTRASSTDATLSGLTVSDGTLDPEFASATEDYTASVIHSVDELTLTPTVTEATATVAYLNASNAAITDADGTAEGHQVALTVGSNTIKVKVTAGNGTTEKTYTVTVTRGTAAADATLSGLTLSPGTLAPEFASTTEGYTASVANAVSRLTVTPTASQSGATVSYLDGENATLSDADGATAGHQVDLTVGENTIKVGVTATDGTTTKTYTVTVTRASSTDATLSGLTVSAGTLDPEFASATEGYTASVIHSVDELTLTPTATEATATVAYLDGENATLADADGEAEGLQVALTVGENTIKVKVTAGNGTTEKTYTVTVTRGTAAADATLSGLTLSPGTLAPEFASTTEGYTASVANAVSRLTVTPTASQSGATVAYLNASNTAIADADDTAEGQQVDLTVGENTIKVGVTATNGTTTKTYTVTVTRASSTDATLSGLTVSAGTLDPEFASATEGYTASVIHSVDELTLTPTATEATATVAYLNASNTAIADADGTAEGHQVALTVGSNTIKVKVTAEDETTTKTYTVVVTRAATAGADATLSGLTVNPGTLDPVFASTTESYTASVGNAVDEVTVAASASHAEATVSYLDGENATLADADGAAEGQQVALTVGSNTIKVKVTAGNGETEKTYTVTVARGVPSRVSAVATGATSIEVTWTMPATTPSRVGVDISGDGETWSDEPCSDANYFMNCRVWLDATATSYTHTRHVGGGSTRHYRIFADHTGSDHDARSVPVSATTWRAPAATATRADGSAGDSAINVSWTAVATLGDVAVTGYGIEVSTDGATWTTLVADTGNINTTYAHTGLPRGAFRYYHVRVIAGTAVTGFGRSDSARTKPNLPGKPVVTLARVPNIGLTPNSVANSQDWIPIYRLSWPTPDDGAEGSVNLSYRFGSANPDAVETVGEMGTNTDGTGNSLLVRGAAADVLTIRVRAVNSAGTGPWSDTFTEITTSPDPETWQGETRSLTARFANLPTSHDGSTAFTFELHFSDSPEGLSDRTVGGGLLDVSGGNVVHARRLTRGSNGAWEVSVEPTQDGDITISLPARGGCGERRTVCARGQSLMEGVSAIVPGAAFEASFSQAPAEHDGTNAFELRFQLSTEPTPTSYVTVRDSLFEVTGGTIANAARLVRNRSRGWTLKVAPSGLGDVTLRLKATTACDAPPGICTPDGRMLDGGLSVTVRGPVAVSVADAEVDEAVDATLDFTVTLSRAGGGAVTVDYATSDGTATAGSDYTSTSGTLTFAAGTISKTVSVPVLNDAHDEGSETMTLTLSNSSPARVKLADATATGTIKNTDTMPQAWIARFGRTVADQVLDAVESRLEAPRTAGMEASLAGQPIGGAWPADEASDEALERREAEAAMTALADWVQGESAEEEGPQGFESRAVTERELLLGSSFALTDGSAERGFGALWGRAAVSGFDGRDGGLTVDGEVTSAMVGADLTRGRAMAGLAVAHSRGEGSYRSPGGDGEAESTLTGVYPYGRYALSERVSVWGVAGFGRGSLTLKPGSGTEIETDMALAMGALGLRGVVVEALAEGGMELSVKTDGMMVRTSSDAVSGTGGNLMAAEADVTRLRLGLQATWYGMNTEGGIVTPSVEIGLRHDGGDAETGFGADIGAGLSWADPASGFSAEVWGRGLLTHEADGFGERGFSGTLSWDPEPSTALGPSLTLTQTVGAASSGGAEALLGRGTMEGLAPDEGGDALDQRHLEAKLGYGFALFGGRYTGTPEIGLGLSDAQRDYSLGWRLAEVRPAGLAFGLDVEGARREQAYGDGGPEHRLGLGLGWRLEGTGAGRVEVRFEGTRLDAANDAAEHRLGARMTAHW